MTAANDKKSIFGYKTVDFHAHAFPDKIAEKAALNLETYYNMPLVSKGHFSVLLEKASKANIDKMVIHSTATKASQVENVNNYVSSLIRENPDLLIGFATIHPEYSDYKNELRRVKELGLRGIKLHADFQNFYLDTPEMLPIYEEIIKLDLPILFHMGDKTYDYSSPKRLAWLLEKYPEMTAIGAHLGGAFVWDESIEYLVGKNLYFDTSSTLHSLEPEKFMYIVRKHGADKILFGTDYPLSDYELEFERFKTLDLTDEEKEKIFYKNAYKLLNL